MVNILVLLNHLGIDYNKITMETSKKVTSLELSKRLKELGVKQNSERYWVNGLLKGKEENGVALRDNVFINAKNKSYSATSLYMSTSKLFT